jgi:hypothetical protein
MYNFFIHLVVAGDATKIIFAFISNSYWHATLLAHSLL